MLDGKTLFGCGGVFVGSRNMYLLVLVFVMVEIDMKEVECLDLEFLCLVFFGFITFRYKSPNLGPLSFFELRSTGTCILYYNNRYYLYCF